MKSQKDWEEFVRAWQESGSVSEAAKKMKLDTTTARSRANYLRSKGVPLTKFSNPMRMNWVAMAKLAKSLTDKAAL